MKPVTTGIIVAAAIIVAFIAGMQIQVYRDNDIQQAFDAMANAVDSVQN